MGKRLFKNMILRLKYFFSLPSFICIAYIGVWMFLFYKTILNLKTRFQEQNLKKIIFIFFHYHLNRFICCKTKLQTKFMFYRMRLFYRMNFFTKWIFLTELNLLKVDTNIYFKKITFFEKKRFCKNHKYFFLKNMIFFST